MNSPTISYGSLMDGGPTTGDELGIRHAIPLSPIFLIALSAPSIIAAVTYSACRKCRLLAERRSESEMLMKSTARAPDILLSDPEHRWKLSGALTFQDRSAFNDEQHQNHHAEGGTASLSCRALCQHGLPASPTDQFAAFDACRPRGRRRGAETEPRRIPTLIIECSEPLGLIR